MLKASSFNLIFLLHFSHDSLVAKRDTGGEKTSCRGLPGLPGRDGIMLLIFIYIFHRRPIPCSNAWPKIPLIKDFKIL
jgi:hypothetical protein